MRQKYDAIEATFEQHEEGASGNLSNVWQKNIHGVPDMQDACLFQEWTEHDQFVLLIDFHDDLMYDLGFIDHVELFGVKKSHF